MRVPLRTAHGIWSERSGILVRLERQDGRVGFGEIAPIPGFGTETLEEAEAICRSFGSRVEDERLDSVEPRYGCVRFALAAARSFASDANPSPVTHPIAGLLPAGRGAVEALQKRMEAGYLAIKWKVAVEDIDAELGVLDEISSSLPAYVKLRLDANGGWSRKQAARWLDRCAERPIEFVEQPLSPEDRDGLLGLADDFPVTLALDESVVRLEHAQRWQAEGWRGVYVVKPALAGPLEEMRSWAVATKADVVLSSAIETAVGRAAILRYVQLHGRELTRRALGFGTGGIFGESTWDGPITGPLLDGSWKSAAEGEALWNAQS